MKKMPKSVFYKVKGGILYVRKNRKSSRKLCKTISKFWMLASSNFTSTKNAKTINKERRK